jgi:hypothetical protein
MTQEEINEHWERIIDFMSKNFSDGSEKLDMQAILFFIGIQELGQGFKEFSKQEKMDLLHIAICKLLSEYGYYTFDKKDDDGWPHYTANKEMPPLSPKKQTELMKEAIVKYYINEKVPY